jgi:hypothetical protein
MVRSEGLYQRKIRMTPATLTKLVIDSCKWSFLEWVPIQILTVRSPNTQSDPKLTFTEDCTQNSWTHTCRYGYMMLTLPLPIVEQLTCLCSARTTSGWCLADWVRGQISRAAVRFLSPTSEGKTLASASIFRGSGETPAICYNCKFVSCDH